MPKAWKMEKGCLTVRLKTRLSALPNSMSTSTSIPIVFHRLVRLFCAAGSISW